jgi:hypothetical protein
MAVGMRVMGIRKNGGGSRGASRGVVLCLCFDSLNVDTVQKSYRGIAYCSHSLGFEASQKQVLILATLC